jgi:hypothetical protein
MCSDCSTNITGVLVLPEDLPACFTEQLEACWECLAVQLVSSDSECIIIACSLYRTVMGLLGVFSGGLSQ